MADLAAPDDADEARRDVVEQDGLDQLPRPREHLDVAQRLATDPRRHRDGNEDRAERLLDERARIQAHEAQLLALAQLLDRAEAHDLALDADVADAGGAGHDAQSRDLEEVLHRLGRRAVAVAQLRLDLVDGLERLDGRELLVRLEAQPLPRHVVVRQVRIDRQLDLDLGRHVDGVAAEVGDGLADEADVEVEAHALDVTGLLAAEQVAGAADLEVLHGDGHAGAEVGVARDGAQAVVRRLGHRLLGRVEEVGVGPLASTTHATAQLVQL